MEEVYEYQDVYKETIMTIQEIIKNQVLKEIFNEFPTDIGRQHTFDFFMSADVDTDLPVSHSAYYEWGFEVSDTYRFETVRAIRGLMQSMYSDLEKFIDLQQTKHITGI